MKVFILILFLVSGAFAQSPDDAQALEIKVKVAEAALQSAKAKLADHHPEVLQKQAELDKLRKATLARAGAAPVPLPGDAVSPLTSLQATVRGTFWRDEKWVDLLGLSADQQNKMDDIFQQYRLKLIDLTASLQKEELILEPLVGRTRPSADAEAKILTQIDRIAEARAELEKANSRMLISILQTLTADQWTKLPAPNRTVVKGLKAPAK